MEFYKNVLERARNELSELAAMREQIDIRVVHLKKVIEDIIPLIESEEAAIEATQLVAVDYQYETITEAIKRVFILEDLLTPTEVRDELKKMGFPLTKHANILSTIHSILKRLTEQHWLEIVEKKGKQAYRRRLHRMVLTYAPEIIIAPAETTNRTAVLSSQDEIREAFKRGLAETKKIEDPTERGRKRKQVLEELKANRKALAERQKQLEGNELKEGK
jgi:hypothetical protein